MFAEHIGPLREVDWKLQEPLVMLKVLDGKSKYPTADIGPLDEVDTNDEEDREEEEIDCSISDCRESIVSSSSSIISSC